MSLGIFEKMVKRGKKGLIKCEFPFPLGNSDPYSVINYGSGMFFETASTVSGEWWQISASGYYLSPKAYRIKTFSFASGHTHLKAWKISGSSNNVTWTIIDTQENQDELNAPNKTKEYPLKNFETFFKYIRITIVANHNPNGYEQRLSLSEFDVYGVMQAHLYVTKCMQSKRYTTFSQVILCLLYK